MNTVILIMIILILIIVLIILSINVNKKLSVLEDRIKKELAELLKSLIIAALICFLIIKFIMMSVIVNGSSMNPTLYNGDFGFSFVITKNIKLNRFDTVVIKADEDKKIVKRLIGLPNETVEFIDNSLYIDGKLIEQDFSYQGYTQDLKVSLNEDQYFVLGDNREYSRDSRYYGPFSSKQILSSHILILFPFSDIGFVS